MLSEVALSVRQSLAVEASLIQALTDQLAETDEEALAVVGLGIAVAE